MKLIDILPRLIPSILLAVNFSMSVGMVTENYKWGAVAFAGCGFLFTLALLIAFPIKP